MRRLCFCLALLGCSISEHEARDCDAENPCPTGQMCFRGFCVSDGTDAGADVGPDVMVDVGIDTSPPDAGCMAGSFCFTGRRVDDMVVGRCRVGTAVCAADGTLETCAGEVLPREEICNEIDDDCDGSEDELDDTTCTTTDGLGACAAGIRTCLEGGGERCIPINTPTDEIACNGIDEDCDGQVDEYSDPQCYPPATVGCGASGPCVGICARGTRACDGETEVCNGAITPEAIEACDGVDNNCDGVIDEGCSCTPAEVEPCYSGAPETVGRGECEAGTRTCTAGATWGACMGDVTPVDEDCTNVGRDDDCDGLTDENIGGACDTGADGICAPGTWACSGGVRTCEQNVPAAPSESCNDLDDDCDAMTDEGFMFATDEANCGSCGRACTGALNSCCDSDCVDTRVDREHCGVCGIACDAGEICCNGTCKTMAECAGCEGGCGGDTCCSGVCADLQTDEAHCGACGDPCAADEFCCGGTCVPDDDENACGDTCTACTGIDLCCNGSCVPRDETRCSSCTNMCGAGECCPDAMMSAMCIDTNSDPNNCGGCGVECPGTMLCSGGACCTMCDTECVASFVDNDDHCGMCDRACPVLFRCVGTTCESIL